MKYMLEMVFVFALLAGVPAFLSQHDDGEAITGTISRAWHKRAVEKRAIRGARTLEKIYAITPEQRLEFFSVVASGDGSICFYGVTTDSRKKAELVFSYLPHNEDRITYGLEFPDIQNACADQHSRDLTNLVESKR